MNKSNHLSHTDKKILKYSFLSSMIELYEFTVFGVMLVILSEKFFPGTKKDQTHLGMLSFALTFLISPISAFFWGKLADKNGRIQMIRVALNLMALPSFIISILPEYSQIGYLSFSILIFCRILQGISSSGAYSGIKIFTMESIGKHHFGKIAGALSCAGAIGVLMAMFASYIVAKNSETPNLWRFAFAIGSLLAIIGYFIRKKLTESPEFTKSFKKNNSANITINKYRNEVALIIAISALVGVFSYSSHVFMPNYLVELSYSKVFAYKSGIFALSCTAISSLYTGFVIDRQKKINIFKGIVPLIFAFPICYFLIIQKSETLALVAICTLGLLLGQYASMATIINYLLFPTEIRCRMFLFFYSLSVSIFGGFTPYALNYVIQIKQNHITSQHIAPGLILSLSSLIVFIIISQYKNILIQQSKKLN